VRTVLLRLEGPLQSWGTRSRFARRDTENEPSKSGVVGLIGAALGMRRDDDATLAKLSAGSFGVRVDREGSLLSDYHTVGDGKFRGEPYYLHGGGKNAVITHRDYLQGASFLAAMQFADDALAIEVDAALGAPRWALSLGRRSCAPSLPVRVPGGVVAGAPADALRQATYPAPARRKDVDHGPSRVRLLVECAASDPEGQPRQDQPLSFRLSHRHFARRFVRTEWIEPSELRLLPPEVPCISLVAF
jgi:CRISPR system Cascade subunit CasD